MKMKMTQQQAKQTKQIDQLHKSFRYFLKNIWMIDPSHDLPPNCVPHRVQYDICDWLQFGPHYRITRGFRGLSKSWITVAYCLWRLLRNPNEKIIICSEGEKLAKKALHMMRIWIDNVWFLNHLAPKAKNSDYRDNRTEFDVGPCTPSAAPSVTAMGITSALPGNRASIIIPDDCEGLENARTRDGRQLLRQRVTEFENILLPEGDIIYLGTPHHEETLYDYLVSAMDYKCRTWPLEYPDDTETVPYLSPMLRDDIEDDKVNFEDTERPIWDGRFGRDFILRARLEKRNYAMQFMMRSDLGDLDKYQLRLEDLIVFECDRDRAPVYIQWGRSTNSGPTTIQNIEPNGFAGDNFYGPIDFDNNTLEYRGSKAYLDPAGGGKDEMAWAIMSQLSGYIYWKYVGAVRDGFTPENLTKIVLSLREHGARQLFIETNFGGAALVELIKPYIRKFSCVEGQNTMFPNGWNCSVEGRHSTNVQKEERIISALSVPLHQHRLVVHPRVAADKKTMYQMTHITHIRGSLALDDRIDAAAGCIKEFIDVMGQDAGRLSAEHAAELEMQKTLKRYSQFFAPEARETRWAPVN